MNQTFDAIIETYAILLGALALALLIPAFLTTNPTYYAITITITTVSVFAIQAIRHSKS